MLSQDPFGNYVVQYVLELGHPETSAMVMTNLKGHYGELATQKFRCGGRVRCRACMWWAVRRQGASCTASQPASMPCALRACS